MNENQITAKLNKVRISPKKVAPVMDLVRGKSLEQAKIILAFDPTKASKLILKAVKSAEANAKSNTKANVNKLYVAELSVSCGPMSKSGNFVGHGHFNPILKRTSHIYVGLAERIK